jgi:type IV pilus assembly protein PilA
VDAKPRSPSFRPVSADWEKASRAALRSRRWNGPDGGSALAVTDRPSKGTSKVQLIHSLKSRRDAEEGFTLIELMVVVLIIAILIAIAIPTFLGARSRAQDRAAQSDLRNGLTAEKTFYTDNETYTNDKTVLQGIEPSLQWNAVAPAKPRVTVMGPADAVNASDASVICLSATSKSGTVFSLADVAIGPSAGTYYAQGPCSTTLTDFAGAPWKTSGW